MTWSHLQNKLLVEWCSLDPEGYAYFNDNISKQLLLSPSAICYDLSWVRFFPLFRAAIIRWFTKLLLETSQNYVQLAKGERTIGG